VLKSNGNAYLKIDTDWTLNRLLKKDSTHKHRYSVKEIIKTLDSFVFEKKEVRRKIYYIDSSIKNKIFVTLLK
jgi:hypothetical protein